MRPDLLMGVLVLSTLNLVACSPNLPRAIELCEIGDRREQFAGQKLIVEGELLVSKHGSAVVDSNCDIGLPISWRDEKGEFESFSTIAMRMRGEPGDWHTKVRVSGEMKRARRSEFLDEPYWYLNLESARVVSTANTRADAE